MTLAPRWRKLIGDFGATRGRIALMLAALTIGMLALTTISGAYTILSREIARNYLDINPASALIDVGEVTPENATSSGSTTGSCSSGTGTSPQDGHRITGIGQPQ